MSEFERMFRHTFRNAQDDDHDSDDEDDDDGDNKSESADFDLEAYVSMLTNGLNSQYMTQSLADVDEANLAGSMEQLGELMGTMMMQEIVDHPELEKELRKRGEELRKKLTESNATQQPSGKKSGDELKVSPTKEDQLASAGKYNKVYKSLLLGAMD